MEAKTSERHQTDLILVNGRIFTADPSQPYAEAVAIRGERVLAVGTSSEIATLTNSNTRCIDLQGHVTIPGINDAHAHFPSFDLGGHQLSLPSMEPSWRETQDALAEAVREAPAGTWIFGAVGSIVLDELEANRFALDRVAPDHPVSLIAYSGHGNIVNTKALHALEVAEEESDPMGGCFERVPGSQRINGRIFEYAQWSLSRSLANRIPDADLIRDVQSLADEAVRYGVTSIQNMPFMSPVRCVKLLQEAQLPMRVRVIRMPMTSIDGRDLTEGRDLPLHPSGQPVITVRGTKWILDGTPIERGGALRATYHDRPGWSGRLNFPETEIASMTHESLQWEDQLLLHCSGDKPVKVVFDAMEKVHDVDWIEKRVRIEHGDVLVGNLIPRARRLGVVVVQNPTHLSFVDLMRERYGPDAPFFPLHSLLEAGVPLALGSDGPLNPYLNIMFAILHPINPSEALTREEAIEAYTRGSAFAEFEEREKGTISQGRLADIAVLSQDIFTVPVEALPATESILTLVGGQIAYDAKVLDQR